MPHLIALVSLQCQPSVLSQNWGLLVVNLETLLFSCFMLRTSPWNFAARYSVSCLPAMETAFEILDISSLMLHMDKNLLKIPSFSSALCSNHNNSCLFLSWLYIGQKSDFKHWCLPPHSSFLPFSFSNSACKSWIEVWYFCICWTEVLNLIQNLPMHNTQIWRGYQVISCSEPKFSLQRNWTFSEL